MKVCFFIIYFSFERLTEFFINIILKFNDISCLVKKAILNLETIDIYNLVSGKDELPEDYNTPMMSRIQAFSKEYLGKRLQGAPLQPYHTQ
tara:strand:+ start:228 stop:500 length:273 start_codon:yes stop_codon:yes gene_type:complete